MGRRLQPLPVCPHCGSGKTYIRGFFCSQIACGDCGARGPRHYDHGGYPLPDVRASQDWRSFGPLPPPTVSRSSGDPRDGAGFRPPAPKPDRW